MYEVLISFTGAVTATAGERVEINDPFIVADLLQAGYIKEIKKEAKKKATKKKD